MYEVYIGNILLPVTPEKITYKTKSRNETVTLINAEEISRIRTGGLTEYSFEARLPGSRVPYANYLTTFKEPFVYINEFDDIMKNAKPVMFRLTRRDLPYGRPGFSIKKQVTLEGFTVTEAYEEGFDVLAGITLKEYGEAKSTKYNPQENVAENMTAREEKTMPTGYTVKEGDSLWKICKQELNDSSRCYEIAKLNSINNPDKIYAGQVIYFE